MSSIRRQSIISSLVVYFGFALGLLNTWLFTREGGAFTKEEYGLTATFIAIANIIFSLSSVGMQAFITKFFPYYKAHLPGKKNDQLTWALLIPCAGFVIVLALGIIFRDLLINKIFANSPELLKYYYWVFPFALGYTLYVILESYAWMHGRSVLSNFLKEILFRAFTTLLFGLFALGVLKNFDAFITSYSFAYLFVVAILLFFFYKKDQLHFSFSISNVTRRFSKKIMALASFIWAGGLVFNIAGVFDTIIIAAILPNGMAAVAVFSLAQNITSIIQAPQRAIVSSSVGPLSHAWKEKDYDKINKIYQRSSINQLIFSAGMFSLIWLNFAEAVQTFDLQAGYIYAAPVFFYLGLTRVIDMGTGVNAQIISTSTFWKFEFITGLVLLSIMLVLNYFLTQQLGIVGPAISNLVSFTIYNAIRCGFLWKRYKMQPFSINTLYTLLLTAVVYLLCHFLFKQQTGLLWLFVRSIVFLLLFGAGVLALKLSPDIIPVIQTLRKKLWL